VTPQQCTPNNVAFLQPFCNSGLSVIPTCSESFFKEGCWASQHDKKKQEGFQASWNDKVNVVLLVNSLVIKIKNLEA